MRHQEPELHNAWDQVWSHLKDCGFSPKLRCMILFPLMSRGLSLSSYAVAPPLVSPAYPTHPNAPSSPSSSALWLERLISPVIFWTLLLTSFMWVNRIGEQIRGPEGRELWHSVVFLCSTSEPLKMSTFLHDHSSHQVSSPPWLWLHWTPINPLPSLVSLAPRVRQTFTFAFYENLTIPHAFS